MLQGLRSVAHSLGGGEGEVKNEVKHEVKHEVEGEVGGGWLDVEGRVQGAQALQTGRCLPATIFL